MEIQITTRTYQNEVLCHSHAHFHQIIYPLTGMLQLQLSRTTGLVHQQMFAQIAAGIEHTYFADGVNQFLVLDLPCSVADIIIADLTEGQLKSFEIGAQTFLQADERLQTAFKLIYLHICEGDDSRLMREALTRCLIGSICKKTPYDSGISYPTYCRQEVSAAIAYLHAHYAEDVTVQSMADTVGLGVSQFHHVFLQHTGKTPLNYLTDVRLAEAESLLRLTNKTVLEICLSVGYQSPATFSRLFRRYFGQAPAAYRRIRQENSRIELAANYPTC